MMESRSPLTRHAREILDAGAPAGAPLPDAGPAAPDVAGLFRASHLYLVRLAMLLVGDQATAEDVVQDVFARVCGRSGAGIGPAYFRTAVVNACRSVHRRRAIARRFGGSVEATWWTEPVASPETEVLLTEDRRQVLRALAALPRRQHEGPGG